jgi:hypothetical protein
MVRVVLWIGFLAQKREVGDLYYRSQKGGDPQTSALLPPVFLNLRNLRNLWIPVTELLPGSVNRDNCVRLF